MPIPLLLHGKHAAPGAVIYQPFGPWIVPWRFGALETEYDTLHTRAGLIDYSIYALIEVTGADRISFLHNLLTSDMKRLAPGTGCRTALLTPNAKLIAECLVLVDAASLWLLCDVTRVVTVAQTLERYLFSEQVTLINHERRWAALALQGPQTFALLTRLLGAPIHATSLVDHATHTWQGLPVRIVHFSLTDEPGVLCLVEAQRAHELWERLLRDGQPHGLALVGWEALNGARIEAGIPWSGIDMDESHLLPETGLQTVLASDTKGCYVGQEIVARMQTYGSANKRLMGLLIEGDMVPEAGDAIASAGGEELGRVTSGCRSRALKRPIAMGYLKRGAYEPGTVVWIKRGNQRLLATVEKLGNNVQFKRQK